MAKPYLTDPPFKIRNVNLMDSRMLRQIDLSPASFFAELPNSLAKLETNIRGHPPSIDLVEALYLAHALSAYTVGESRQTATHRASSLQDSEK